MRINQDIRRLYKNPLDPVWMPGGFNILLVDIKAIFFK